ncbi:hypothetical protein GCM10022212_11330 [Actimicrobium antarcticum]|uniref:Uncharacterized protein n=1 Tax=Actimicrobium antarcticum TaxID=1051899 RepID=A0ABP7SX48_9BURK
MFGKTQRIVSGVDPSIVPIICHGAADPLNRVYRDGGVALPATRLVTDISDKADPKRALVLAPPATAGSPWIKRFGDYSDAFASGWLLLPRCSLISTFRLRSTSVMVSGLSKSFSPVRSSGFL